MKKYVMTLGKLLLILHVTTKVFIFYKDHSLVTSGYPVNLFESLPEEVLNLQILTAQATNLNEMKIMVIKRK